MMAWNYIPESARVLPSYLLVFTRRIMLCPICRRRRRSVLVTVIFFLGLGLCFSAILLSTRVRFRDLEKHTIEDSVLENVNVGREERSLPLNISEPVVHGNVARGVDPSAEVRKQREFIVEVMKDAWGNYRRYAWGYNELEPVTKEGHSPGVFGESKMGETIVDALDTLYIMGLKSEYEEGRKWIAEQLEFDSVNAEVSVFESNIRFVGGLLSMYALSGDAMYKDKAYSLGQKLLPAFETLSGIPYAFLTLNQGTKGNKNHKWVPSGSNILSEFGSLHLEFTYLSDITGDPIFKDKVYAIRKVIKEAEKPNGLYLNYFHADLGFVDGRVSIGCFGDSFYEYLLKSYIQTGDVDAREMYDDAMDAFERNGIIQHTQSGLTYFAQMSNTVLEKKMEHLACFAGGLLALGAHTDNNKNERTRKHWKLAHDVTNTCHESYIRSPTRLGPDTFYFGSTEQEARAIREDESYYILRPEVIESYFVLWRLTGNPKYRAWGWDAAQAIQKYCKVGASGGYSGLLNVYSTEPTQDNVQQSFFLAETLKYLYLLFSSNEVIDLSKWVFNTEGHPLPVKATNPFYRAFN